MFQLLRPLPTFARTIYFYVSVFLLLSRTLFVSFCASNLYDQSKKCLVVLRAVPYDSYYATVRRFTEEVVNETIALSGMKIFYLTRPFIISLSGTICAYECILIQFQGEVYRKYTFCNAQAI